MQPPRAPLSVPASSSESFRGRSSVSREARGDAEARESASLGPLSSSEEQESPSLVREASAGSPVEPQPSTRRAGAAVVRRAQGRGRRRGEGSEWESIPARARNWVQGLGSVIVAAGWGEVGAVVPDARHWRLLRSQVRMVLRQLPLLERAGEGQGAHWRALHLPRHVPPLVSEPQGTSRQRILVPWPWAIPSHSLLSHFLPSLTPRPLTPRPLTSCSLSSLSGVQASEHWQAASLEASPMPPCIPLTQ